MIRNTTQFVRMSIVCLFAAAPLLSTRAPAQQPRAGATDDLAAQFARGPHTGSWDQALVAIEVTNISSDGAVQQTKRGNGFVLRCDGFVIAPSSLFNWNLNVAGSQESAGKQAVAVILNPGTAAERRVPGRRPRFVPRDLGYAVLKLDRIHTPALPILLPSSVKPGDVLTIASTRWDDATKRYLPPLRVNARYAGPEAEDDEKVGPGPLRTSEPVEGVQPGAVVVGPDGLGVGLVTSAGLAGRVETFVGFGVLEKATNCVTPLSRPPGQAAAQEQAAQPAGADQKADETPMVHVAGGPVELPRGIVSEQPDMEAATLACVAPFEIDRFEVTNKQYLEFWNTIPESEQKRLSVQNRIYPLTWSKSGAPFPSDLADAPVLGVALPGAQAYAAYHGKRLPTPYEWCLAAFGPQGDKAVPEWAQRYVSERRSTWFKIKDMHLQYLQVHPELYDNGLIYKITRIPWIASMPAGMQAATWSKQTVDQQTQALWSMYKDPLYVIPVGNRDFDISPCGAADMLLNADEMVTPYPGPPTLGNARYMEVAWNKLPIRPPDEWLPRYPELVTSDERELPPLSRLYRRNMIGPPVEEVVMWSSINEAAQMLAPLAGLQLRMSGAATSTAVGRPRSTNAFAQLQQPPGYSLWQGMPRHFRVEVGMPIPFDKVERHAGPTAHLFYYYPNGFRCVR